MAYTTKPEHALQTSVSNFFKAHMVRECLWTAADHGSHFRGDALQRANAWNRLAARGVQKSIPDFPLIFHRSHLHAIEMKAGDGRLDEGQVAWGQRQIAAGGTWDVCRTRAEVWASMCRAFPDDNPLKPPPALLALWLAKDDVPAKPKPLAKARNPRIAKPKATRGQVARGNLAMLALARGPGRT